MFDFIRSHQRLMQFVLLVLIVPSFALIGVSGYNSYVSGDEDIVKVGKSAITVQQYEQARANQLRQMQERSGGNFDPDVLDRPEVKRDLINQLVDYRVVAQWAAKEHFSASDVRLRTAIAAMPQLQVEGQFSQERYEEALAAIGMSMQDFEQAQRYELALGRVLEPVSESAHVPGPVVYSLAQALTDERALRVQAFVGDDFLSTIEISEDDVNEWYEQNKSDFGLPEQARIQYLVLDEAAAMDGLPALDESQLQDYYTQNKNRFTKRGRIDLSHIQINVAPGATPQERDEALARAQEILEELKTGDTPFADVAKKYSEDAGTARSGGDLGWISQGSWPAGLDQAIFSLKEGETSEVIDGPGGYHIFLAKRVEPEKVQSFDEVQEQIQDEVRRQLGAERFADMATQLTDLLYDHPDSLEPAADALGLTIRQASGIGRDRLLTAAEAGADAAVSSDDAELLDDPRVRRTVYSTQVRREKHNSGVIEISPDTMLALRIQEVIEAHIPEVDQLRAQIRARLMQERGREAAVAHGQERLAQLQAGEAGVEEHNNDDASDVADAVAPVDGFSDLMTVSRMEPGGIDQEALDTALSVPIEKLPAYAGVETARGFTIVRVEAAPSSDVPKALLASLEQELAALWGQAEQQATLHALREQTGVEMLPQAQDLIEGRELDGD